MKKISRVFAIGVAILFLFSACQPVPPIDREPSEVVKEGIKKLSDIAAYSFDVVVNGDLRGPEGIPPEKMLFEFKLAGGIDMKNPEDPKLLLTVLGKAEADSQGVDANFELRLNKSNLFMNLLSLNVSEEMGLPSEMLNMFLNKWWSLPVPPEVLAEIAANFPQGGEENLTEDQKQFKSLIENSNFFMDVQYIGVGNVMGESSFHYGAKLNKDEFIEFSKKAAELQNSPISPFELELMRSQLESFDMGLEMFVGSSSGIMNRVIATIEFLESTANGPIGKIQIDASAGKFNQSIKINEPQGAESFPINSLLGLMSGGVDFSANEGEMPEGVEFEMPEGVEFEMPEGVEFEMPEGVEFEQ